MLHVILGILKWIGILLLAVLVLLLAVAAAILFSPVRYRGEITKTEQACAARLRVGWLLHLLTARLEVDVRTGSRSMEIFLFGIPLGRYLALLKKLSGLRRRREGTRNRRTLRRKQAGVKKDRPGPDASGSMRKDPDSAQESSPDEKVSDSAQEGGLGEKSPDSAWEDGPDEKSPDSAQEGSPEEQNPDGIPNTSKRSIRERLRALSEQISLLPERICRIWKRLMDILPGISQKGKQLWAAVTKAQQNARAVPDKLEQVLTLMEEYEVRELLGDGWEELLILLRHYVPRRIQGYLKFGTGDPASTGELTGLLYLLLPAKAQLSIEPDFNERFIETELVFAGHIRSVHAVRTAWHLFRNQKLRRFIKRVRTKGV